MKFIKNKDKFPEPKPKLFLPIKPKETTILPPPDPKDIKYQPKYGFLDSFSKKKREEIKKLAHGKYLQDFAKWEEEKADILNRNKIALENYKKKLEEIEMQDRKNIREWELRRQEFLRIRKEANKVIDTKRKNISKKIPMQYSITVKWFLRIQIIQTTFRKDTI